VLTVSDWLFYNSFAKVDRSTEALAGHSAARRHRQDDFAPSRDLAHLEVWKHVTAEQVDIFQARLMGIELPTRSVEA